MREKSGGGVRVGEQTLEERLRELSGTAGAVRGDAGDSGERGRGYRQSG